MGVKVKVVKRGDRKSLYLRWVDPETGQERQKAAGTVNRSDALREAGKLADQLEAGKPVISPRVSWGEFRERYEGEKLSALAKKTGATAGTALNHVENILHPKRLADVTAERLSHLQAKLRADGLRETSIATQLRHIRAALSWARSVGILRNVPAVAMPKRVRGTVFMRGRPITGEEFDRMLTAAEAVRPADAAAWQRYLRGLWLSGLRLGESLALGWTDDAPIAVCLDSRRPCLRILAEAEKGHQDRLLPMTPDFAEFLFATPVEHRQGQVFRLDVPAHVVHVDNWVGRVVSAIGEKAAVVVNKAEGKFASAHDLRRAFGTRWSARVKPATLQLLMRHRSIETTMRYYVAQGADDVAEELWAIHPMPRGDSCGGGDSPSFIANSSLP